MGKSMPPAPATPDKDPYLGGVINDHIRLVRLLGIGGMSRVYATAKDPSHPVRAVKLLNTDLVNVVEAVARFQREANIMMELEHPNVVQVFESGVAQLPPFNGVPFVVMKYVRGKTLEEMMQEMRDAGSNGRIPFEQAVIYLSQVCAGLIDAHERGIIHRDIKPSNVFVETHPGVTQVLLTDFGIACFQDPTHAKVTLADRGEVMGTPNYMAPEQAAGERALTTKVDVYSLGVMAYEILCGSLPIQEDQNDSTQSYMMRVITEVPQTLQHVMPGVDNLLNEIIMACLAKDPTIRPTVRQFRDGLAHATGARINRSVRPSDPQIDLMPARVPFDMVVPTREHISEPLPLVTRKAVEDSFDTAQTTERMRSTDPPPPPVHRLPAWASVLIIVVGVAMAGGIIAAAIRSREFGDTVAAGDRPRTIRHVRSAVVRRPEAAAAAVVAVAVRPRNASMVRPDVPVHRTIVPLAPPPLLPDPRVVEVNAHGTACMAALGSRTRPDGWQSRCRAYVAVRCPETGSRAVDCDLIETMLHRMTPRPRPRPRPEPVEDENSDESVEPAP